ncbi:hypothetical protein PHYSODRAFT_254167 [Phytophthora sojae]|uniref:Uncharacterized protein n=1 Tax=Phytophthora sojae (strain P6497) TaxID=1094619 RepID=G5A8Z1_PHYSP|nr:hypothetical protein PHYSODRAFT_254167 [Phytophthora sojae]EGZ08367.1 hypothetical protein PHYSODRAFT_254167 [Phytophthora sojae]|eukprot:XP_009536539.1 hypothetical protein PHYSODRAFT_254167 [Phytophthora sojae]
MTKKRWFRFDGRPLASLRVPEDAEDVGDLCDALLQQLKLPWAKTAALKVYTNAAYNRGERLGLHIKLGAIGEDPADPFIVELSRIWFQLVSSSPGGAAFKNTYPDAALAPEGSTMSHVLETIFGESGGILDGLSTSQHVAYESRNAKTPLERDAAAGASGRAENAPLIVVVRQPHERVWHLSIDQKYVGAIQQYKEVAHLLKDSPEVKTIESVTENFTASGTNRFIVLENSSGTGKTQMAFNLEANGVYDVFYVLSTYGLTGIRGPQGPPASA